MRLYVLTNPMRGFSPKRCQMVWPVILAFVANVAGLDAATFNVTNTSDSGNGSLRQAILDANSTPGTDTINFNIPGSGLHSITPSSVLPTITDPVVIDGYTQPGSSANTLAVGDNSVHRIELKGNGAALHALNITAGNSAVRGLVINSFNGNGSDIAISLQTGGGNTVVGCFLGLTADGTAAATNRDFGIDIEDSPNNLIGGTIPAARNVIAGNNTQILINGNASSGTTIQGNYIGTNAAGTAALSSGGVSQSVIGININTNISSTGPSNTLIGGTTAGARNVIAGNASGNINFFGSIGTGNVIQGNYVGINAAGTAAIDLNGTGIALTYSSNYIIGGTSSGARNVISGNSAGIALAGDINFPPANNLIQGNLIGTNAAGTAAVPNGNGITLAEGHNNTIGGTTLGSRNIISGNVSRGIVITTGYNTPVVTANLVQGNFIGTDITGLAKLGNGGDGIVVAGIFGATLTGVNTIGGATAGAGNIISGSVGNGISLGTANNTVIQGNLIGTDIHGTGNLGNAGIGISLSAASTSTIGLNAAGAGARNVIAFNGSASTSFAGVVVYSGVGNSIRGNSIFSDNGLGIDLGGSGLTPNDAGDADTGANNLQNYPVLSTVTGNGTTTNITGSLNSVASKTYRLEFFTNDSVDPSGYGEGKTFLTAINVATNAAGNATFNFNVPQLASGLHVTSTATDPAGNTSEFSGANGQLLNISTRLGVLTGDKVGIGGFIIKGVAAKTVLVVGLGPSLAPFGISNFLADPILTLFRGSTTLATNDNWMDTQAVAINATGKAPQNNVEPAILQTLAPGSYTAVLGGKNNSTGVALVEVFDQSPASNSDLTNISTRGFVSTGSSVMIGGFISGNGIRKVIVRALGPTLADFHVTSVLADPVLSIHDANGNEIASNDNWQDTQAAEIQASGFAPPKPVESAIILTRPPGNTTAIVSGKNNTTGNALVEVYNLP